MDFKLNTETFVFKVEVGKKICEIPPYSMIKLKHFIFCFKENKHHYLLELIAARW